MQQFLNDRQFEQLYAYLQSERIIHAKKKEALRQFLEAVFWMCRSGAQWVMLPEHYGRWNSIYKRFNRWSQLGVWERMFHYFARDPDMESVMIDSTIVRAHACASGAKGGKNIRR